ncbi:hypothetical protein LUZ60_014574 [Juncus effusus]|nr:hypothetical protein LUZ60_014574 [Juncus effusus]
MAESSVQSSITTQEVQVQKVTKASSDKLLLKFADPDSNSPKQNSNRQLPLALRRKKSSRRVASGLSARELSGGSDEWKKVKRRRSGGSTDWRAGLLLPVTTREKKNGSLIRRIGIGRMDDAVGIGLILAALERTWQKTVASASKVFVEKHRTDHVRLISDMV